MIKSKKYKHSKGMVLLIILLLVAAITIIGLGFIVRGDTELLCGQNMELRADMDSLAESGLEHAKGLIMYPQDLAGEYWTGAISQQTYVGPDYYDINVTKLSECDWQITSTGYRQVGGSRASQSSLTAKMRLDPDVAFWSGTGVSLSPAANITGDVYCNGVLTNSGTINGDCFADSLAGNAISGQTKAKTDLQLSRPTINCSMLTSNFSTQTLIVSSLNNTNENDTTTQVYYRNGNLEIKKSVIINGCLAVDGNLTVSDISNVINAKKNVPAIYVSGNLIIKENASLDCNGLVFVDGRIEIPIINQSMGITGALFTDDGIGYTVFDGSVSRNNGAINGGCTLAAGFTNGAINFNGSSGFINIGNPSQLNFTNRVTIGARIKVNSFNNSSANVISKGSTWSLQRSGSTNFVEFVCASGTVIGTKNVNDGLWHSIVGVYNGSTLSLYFDGVLDTSNSVTGNMSADTSPVYIGANSAQANRYFNGLIDEVRVYNRALTLAQVKTIGTYATNLVGYWSMDWGNSTTMITAAPTKAAIYHWPGGVKDRWSPAAGAFYKSIARNP
ncbi:MAG: LamG domain-containing protein [Phycisphaerae bacterium]|nr:LamG domain-containing protein [Phycisphaerae bacterium]